MPRKDTYHEVAKAALIKEGWTITHDPYVLKYLEKDLFVDLGADAPLGAERAGEKIAVEIKTFLGPSAITELERALGQYILYRSLLRHQEADRVIYLALPVEAYNTLLDTAPGRDLIQVEEIHLLIFDVAQEVITQWID